MPEFKCGQDVKPGDYFVKPETAGSGGAILRFGLVITATQDFAMVRMSDLTKPTRMQPSTFRSCLKAPPEILPPGTVKATLGEWERFVK